MSVTPFRNMSARSRPRPSASPDQRSGSSPPARSTWSAGEPAFEQLDPPAVHVDLHLAAGGGVRMRRVERPVPRSGHDRRDDELDHLVEVAGGQRLAAAYPPQVELVRLADVQAVDHVAAVDEARARHDDVVGVTGPGEAAQRPGHHRRHVRAQQTAVVDVARVAGLAGGGVGRVAERLVVVGDRDDRARTVDEHRSAPDPFEGIADRGRDELHTRAARWPGRTGRGARARGRAAAG